MGRTIHGKRTKGGSTAKLTNNCCIFGIMGGTAPLTGVPLAHRAYLEKRASRKALCITDCAKGHQYLKDHQILGCNPQAGGVGNMWRNRHYSHRFGPTPAGDGSAYGSRGIMSEMLESGLYPFHFLKGGWSTVIDPTPDVDGPGDWDLDAIESINFISVGYFFGQFQLSGAIICNQWCSDCNNYDPHLQCVIDGHYAKNRCANNKSLVDYSSPCPKSGLFGCMNLILGDDDECDCVILNTESVAACGNIDKVSQQFPWFKNFNNSKKEKRGVFLTIGGEGSQGEKMPHVDHVIQSIKDGTIKGIIYDLEGLLGSIIEKKNVIKEFMKKIRINPRSNRAWHVICPLGHDVFPYLTDEHSNDIFSFRQLNPELFDESNGFTHIAPMMYGGTNSYQSGKPPLGGGWTADAIINCISATHATGFRYSRIIATYQTQSLYNGLTDPEKYKLNPNVLNTLKNIAKDQHLCGLIGWGAGNREINTYVFNELFNELFN